MDSKYYTPTIDEFYVGFEYEEDIRYTYSDGDYRLDGGENWIDYMITMQDDLEHLSDLIENDQCRVKYLDKEDIESLEWSPISYDEFQYKEYELYFKEDLQISILKQPEFLFQGSIKNKSELVKLLRQLGIYGQDNQRIIS